ncbi:MAG TPA: DUF2807 domain-containing protein, partial [Parvularculaceae bacterium]|nr:DUF2807 domain-containing protein [Parvularculaceae bacterium]
MKKTMLGVSALAGLALASGAALADQKTYDFKNFDSVSVSAGIHLVLTAGGDYSIRAEGDEDALDKLDIKLRGDKLDIG